MMSPDLLLLLLHTTCTRFHTVYLINIVQSSFVLLNNLSLSTWLASLSSTSSYSEILQSAGGKDQLSIQGFQYRCTDYLELSVFNLHLRKVPLPSPPSRHIWKQNCSLLHTTQSNISSAASASDSNSRHTAPPISVFDIDIDINYVYLPFAFIFT